MTSPVGSQFRVNTFTTGNQGFPFASPVAMDANGNFVITWSSSGQDSSGYGIYAQRYNAAGVPQGSEFRVNTFTTGDQSLSSIAMDANGNFVITWSSSGQDGSGYGVYGQRYNAAGVPQGSEFRVNTFTTGDQGTSTSSIAINTNGDFVITWISIGQDGSDGGIYAQRYNAAGVPQGREFRVNTSTTNEQVIPDIAIDTNGNFVITWYNSGLNAINDDVYAQRYNAAGVPQGNEFRVNTLTPGPQVAPSIAMNAGGDFVITWISFE